MKFRIPDSLRQTHLSLMRRCPTQLYFYLCGLKRKPSGALVVGSKGHETLDTNFTHKLRVKEDLPEKEFLGDWESRFDHAVNTEEIDWQGKDPTLDYKQPMLGTKATSRTASRTGLLPLVHKTHLPKLEPIMVEKKLKAELPGGVSLEGTLDFYGKKDGKLTLRDHKFRGKNWPVNELPDQLLTYKIMLEASGRDLEVETLAEDSLVYGTKTPGVTSHEFKNPVPVKVQQDLLSSGVYPIMDPQRERLILEYQNLWRQIHHFGQDPHNWPMTDPTNWACSSRFCGYWNKCPRGGGRYV